MPKRRLRTLRSALAMSALGQKQTCAVRNGMSTKLSRALIDVC